MTRVETLDRAKQCVCGQRENEYGSPEDNFRSIAALWSTYKNTDFTATDVAMMMALLKIARIKTGTATEDSFVDLAGYAACGAEVSSKTKRRTTCKGCIYDTELTCINPSVCGPGNTGYKSIKNEKEII